MYPRQKHVSSLFVASMTVPNRGTVRCSQPSTNKNHHNTQGAPKAQHAPHTHTRRRGRASPWCRHHAGTTLLLLVCACTRCCMQQALALCEFLASFLPPLRRSLVHVHVLAAFPGSEGPTSCGLVAATRGAIGCATTCCSRVLGEECSLRRIHHPPRAHHTTTQRHNHKEC